MIGIDKTVLVIAQDFSQYFKGAVLVAVMISFLSITLIVPIIEELYFRGFLLARMQRFGVMSVFLNSLLFAIYHFWSPWLILTRFIALTPLFYVVYKRKSIWIGILVHCLSNFVTVVEMLVIYTNM